MLNKASLKCREASPLHVICVAVQHRNVRSALANRKLIFSQLRNLIKNAKYECHFDRHNIRDCHCILNLHILIPSGRKVILPTTALKIYIVFLFHALRCLSASFDMHECMFSLPAGSYGFISITAGISRLFAVCTEASWCNKLLIFHSVWQNTIKINYKGGIPNKS